MTTIKIELTPAQYDAILYAAGNILDAGDEGEILVFYGMDKRRYLAAVRGWKRFKEADTKQPKPSVPPVAASVTKRLGGLVHRENACFRAIESKGRFYVECLTPNCYPRIKRLSKGAFMDLTHRDKISDLEFTGACVMIGCGVYEEPQQ